VLKKGNRLSITPVETRHWRHILQTLGVDALPLESPRLPT